LRIRPESFADHYSQARQFFISQTDIEQKHITDELVFELSRVERPAIRTRVVSHLLNIDEGLAAGVAAGLGLKDLPAPATAAKPTRDDLAPSDALSILKNPPPSLAGRKIGVLLSDGASAEVFNAVTAAADMNGVVVEIIAPMIEGVELDDGTWVKAHYKIDGGPSVLFDSVVVLLSADGTALLDKKAAARDFIADAFAHMKFIGYSPEASPLIEKATGGPDEACVELATAPAVDEYFKALSVLRHWPREPLVNAS
jgi:catalase